MLKLLTRRRRLLLSISFLTTFAESMMVPMYAAFTEKLGGSILDAGIAFATFSMATGVFIILIGTRSYFQQHVKSVLVLGFFLAACCDLSYIFVQNRWQLFAVQVVAGLATGFIEPSWDSLFTEDIEDSSAKHWSIWAGGTHLLAGVAALAGGVIVAYFSFKTLFLTMGLVDMVATVLAWRSNLTGDLPKDAPAAAPPLLAASPKPM
jgi:MFS family permease